MDCNDTISPVLLTLILLVLSPEFISRHPKCSASRIERIGTFVDGDAIHTTQGKVNFTVVGDGPTRMTFSNWECTDGALGSSSYCVYVG